MRTIDWLVIGIIVVIVLLLADGMRRKWRDRHNRVVMKLDKNIPPPPDDDTDIFPSSELPNGGARTIYRDGFSPSRNSGISSSRNKAGSAPRVDPDTAVPLLIDSVELEEEDIEHTNVYSSAEDPEQFSADDFDEAAEYPDEDDDFDEEDDATDDPRAVTNDINDDDIDDEELDDEELDDEELDDEELDDEELDDEELDDEELDDEELDDGEDYEDYPEDEDELAEDDDADEDSEEYDDNYESEPALLEGAYQKAASHFQRQDESDEERMEPGFGEDELDETFDPDEFLEDFSDAFDDESEAPGEDEQQLRAENRESSGERNVPEISRVEKRSFFSRTLGKQDQAELFRQEAVEKPEPEEEDEAPQEVIILNVMARPGSYFEGNDLVPVLQNQGMRLGDMSIFHLHGQNNERQVLFSMANMVKPGTFDLAAMDDFTTPGVSFFLQLPNRNGNMASFECMFKAATALKQALDGELKDEHRSVCTQQTIEHCRQRIRDFELSRLTRR